MDTITAWWNGRLVSVFNGSFDMIAKVLISVGTLSDALIHWAPVVNAMATAQVLATAVHGLKVGLDEYSRYILQLSGEDGDPLNSVLIRVGAAAALVWWVAVMATVSAPKTSEGAAPGKPGIRPLNRGFSGRADRI